MTTTTANNLKETKTVEKVQTNQAKASFITRYWANADRAEKENVFWFLKALMVIPTVVIIPAVFLMAIATPNFAWFAGLCVFLFFANLILHIGGAKGRQFVPFYHATIAVLILIPLIAYLITL